MLYRNTHIYIVYIFLLTPSLKIEKKQKKNETVNTEGKLYTFGSNNKKGMLGVGAKNSKDRHKLTEVKALRGVDIASVACG